MTVPARYKETVDFFEGLQVIGELVENNLIKFKRSKSKNSLQLLIKTSLGSVRSYNDRRLWFFKEENFGRESKLFFSFTVTMERERDEILIHAFLPKAYGGDFMLNRGDAVKRMYQNGFLLDLHKTGFEDAKINDVSGHGYELCCKAGPKVSSESISQVYAQVKLMNTKTFEAVGVQI